MSDEQASRLELKRHFDTFHDVFLNTQPNPVETWMWGPMVLILELVVFGD